MLLRLPPLLKIRIDASPTDPMVGGLSHFQHNYQQSMAKRYKKGKVPSWSFQHDGRTCQNEEHNCPDQFREPSNSEYIAEQKEMSSDERNKRR